MGDPTVTRRATLQHFEPARFNFLLSSPDATNVRDHNRGNDKKFFIKFNRNSAANPL